MTLSDVSGADNQGEVGLTTPLDKVFGAALLDPVALESILKSLEWEQVENSSTSFHKWRTISKSKSRNQSTYNLIIPLDSSRGDYEELLQHARNYVVHLAEQTPQRLLSTLASITEPAGDTLSFRKQSRLTAGRVPWTEGRSLFDAAEQTLLAAAKAEASRAAYFGNTNGAFAHRFLDACVMGQTKVGSFIVTAFAPTDEIFHNNRPQVGGSRVSSQYTGRDITRRLVDALGAAQEAAITYERTGSLGGFEEAVQLGVSREMTQALGQMVSGETGTDVSVEWHEDAISSPESQDLPVTRYFELVPSYREAFTVASEKLSSMAPPLDVEVVGWVSVLSRPRRGELGVIRLRVLQGAASGVIRVLLSELQFEVAMESMRLQEALTVTGSLELEGKTRWIRNAQVSLTRFPEEE